MIFFVALLNMILSIWICKVRNYGLRIIALLLTPLILAFVIYYMPVLLKGDSGEYSSWSGLFLMAWWVVGVLSLLIGCFVMRMLKKRNPESDD
jgi:hypothetical protein